MSAIYSEHDELKKRIRRLKKVEIKIRFGHQAFAGQNLSVPVQTGSAGLVWDDFFNLHKNNRTQARYSLDQLLAMSGEQMEQIVSEFLWQVSFRFFKENGIVNSRLFDPSLLVQMGLPYDADSKAVKKRFRELAKQYHPDTGGDSARFIDLIETYQTLTDR